MVRGGCTHLFFKRNHMETISGYYHFETLPIYHQPTDQCLCILLYRKGYRPCVSKPSGFRTDRFWPFDNETLLSQAVAGSAHHTSELFFFFFSSCGFRYQCRTICWKTLDPKVKINLCEGIIYISAILEWPPHTFWDRNLERISSSNFLLILRIILW